MHAIVPSSPSSFIHPMYWPQASNSAHNDVPLRLKSPFQPASSFQAVDTPSRNSYRRAHQQRPHCVRADCPVESALSSSSPAPHPFDELSWISMMNSSSEDYGLSDIADLSQLPVSSSTVDETSFGAGPVRRSKACLHRSSPLRAASGSSTKSTHHASILRSRHLPAPSTPRPRLSRSRIAFHDLMPLFTCDIRKYHGSNPSAPAY
ncbi:hypothetical protein DFJ43DRAFT_1151129 [Lentinula guzmanii]|uniref:Uncharacterized protein n=1 Tax=Lentinula guzmanii TaxID=2804957 RepID=A0AA38N478_9AGAR|nr:hypothetical protein DFJ43DRAFT_1151129 [Lentinula guzmanii]